MLHEKDNGPHPPYVEVTTRKLQPERDICDYPGCNIDSVAKFNVNVSGAGCGEACGCTPHVVQTLACSQHINLLDFISGGFKNA